MAYSVNGVEHMNTTYEYDELSRLKYVKENGATTMYVWDGGNMAAELTGGFVSATYLRGANLIYSQKSGVKAYFGFNTHGDAVHLTDASGNSAKLYHYDAFGNDIETTQSGGSGSTDSNPFRFAGEYFDVETGTYYLRARYHDPATGRMLTEDPIRT